MVDGWVCPHCGQTESRHGRGGSRACDAEQKGPVCPGLICQCSDGVCFSRGLGYGWRRSPCPNAVCQHCGWRGTIRSAEFEREYGSARCPKSTTGFHHAHVRVDGNRHRTDHTALVFDCKICGAKGFLIIDPIKDIEWKLERTAPPGVSDALSQEGDLAKEPGQPGGVGR